MATNTKLIKPPIYLFLLHFVLFISSVAFYFFIQDLRIAFLLHLLCFSASLIFLTVNKNLEASRNYSLDWTVQLSRPLIFVYSIYAAYISWEYGSDYAFKIFLDNI